MKLRIAALLMFFAATVMAADEVKHSLFIAGPSFTGILDEDRKEEWNANKAGARDGFFLTNGNVLIAWSDEVKEFSRGNEQKVVWVYKKSPDNAEIGTVERLHNGNTLVTELGKKPRLMEIAADGQVAVEFALAPETDNNHMQ